MNNINSIVLRISDINLVFYNNIGQKVAIYLRPSKSSHILKNFKKYF